MTSNAVDALDAPQMARWLRETAANTRAKQNQVQLTTLDRNLAPHVAFRLEQAAEMLLELHQFHDWAEPQCRDNAAQLNEIERLRAYQQQMNGILQENERLRAERDAARLIARKRKELLVEAGVLEGPCEGCAMKYPLRNGYHEHGPSGIRFKCSSLDAEKAP
jgi:hypothetical protein